MKPNLQQITFNIPVRIDSQDRLDNLNYSVEFLLRHFDTNVIVYENGPEPRYPNRNKVKHIFEQNNGPFHRTKYLNIMARLSTTPYIANYDCDVVFPTKQVVKAYQVLQNGESDAIYPYDGYFVDLPRDLIVTNFGKGSMGGAIFWNKKVFMDGGMENEYCVSWGCEDWERAKRFAKLGYRVSRVKGPLFHIHHGRGADSDERNPHYENNVVEFKKVDGMTKEQLAEYVKTWPWLYANP
jgi:hypothetical protein